MKFITIFALIASVTAISPSKSLAAGAVKSTKKGDEDASCEIDMTKNKHGPSRCSDASECKGAMVCESQDKNNIGWCRGPDACALAPKSKFDDRVDVENWNGSTHGGLK